MRITVTAIFTVALLFFVASAAFATSSSDTTQATTSQQSTQSVAPTTTQPVDISSGLPTVTPDSFTQKVNRITGAIYAMFSSVIQGITVGAVVVGAVLGIFFAEARRTVFWAIFGLLLVLWAPYLVSLTVGLTKV